jgi:hypothetical protein
MFRLRNLALVVALHLLLISVPAAQAHSSANPRVLPPNARPHGLTYSQWSATWWQYIVTLPAAENPLVDATGTICAVGLTDHVALLLGSVAANDPANPVNCTVPAGTKLFVAVLAVGCLATEGETEAELRACSHEYSLDNMQATLDGKPVKNLDRYIVESPLFEYTLPQDNILGAPAGTTSQGVARGAYLMFKPLPVGTHTLHTYGSVPELNQTFDINYRIMVVPPGQF